MATRDKKTEEKVESVDLAPVQKELERLRKEVEALKKDMTECKKASNSKQSSTNTSALAQQLVDALKEMTGPNTKGVRNYIRDMFR